MTTLSGPRISSVVTSALTLYRDVHAGRWSAAVDLTEDRFVNPLAARHELDLVAADVHVVEMPEPQVVDADTVVFDGAVGVLRSALNLYMRVLLGQFGELAWTTGGAAMVDACNAIRATYQRPGAWPELARASWSIAGEHAPHEAKVAYDAWKLLGGGVAGRPLLMDAVHVS